MGMKSSVWGIFLISYSLVAMEKTIFLSLSEVYRHKEEGLLYAERPKLSSIELSNIIYSNHAAMFSALVRAETIDDTKAINSFSIELRNEIRELEPIVPALSVCFFALPSALFYDLLSFVNYLIKVEGSSPISEECKTAFQEVWTDVRKKYAQLPEKGPGKNVLDVLKQRIDALPTKKKKTKNNLEGRRIRRTKSCAIEPGYLK